MESSAPPRACGIFVSLITVLMLVIFETLFFLFYIAPRVEEGNIRLNADAIAQQTSAQLFEGFPCDTVRGPVLSGVEAFPLPADSPTREADNRASVTSVSIVLSLCAIVLMATWFLYLRGRIRFPWGALARESLPLLGVFAIYDYLYFEFFVRQWETGTADEFLYAMARQVAGTTA